MPTGRASWRVPGAAGLLGADGRDETHFGQTADGAADDTRVATGRNRDQRPDWVGGRGAVGEEQPEESPLNVADQRRPVQAEAVQGVVAAVPTARTFSSIPVTM